MNKDDAAILIFVITLLGALAVIIISLMLRHKRALLLHTERLTAMEKGIDIPPAPMPTKAPWTPRIYLLRGLIWLFSGLGVAAFLAGVSLSTRRPMPIEYRLDRAQDMRARQVPESEVQLYLKSHENDQMGTPYGVALFGLIPAGVGLAYLVFYRAEASRMSNGG